jgi:thioredoxin 1
MRLRRIGVPVVLVAALAAGCSQQTIGGPAGTATARPTATPSAIAAPTTRPSPSPSPARPVATAPGYLYDPAADARSDVEAAFKAAKASGKRVLIDYGADWCPDCHSLAAFMEGAAGRSLIGPAFEVVKVDVGYWDHNLDVAGEYGNAIANGIPAVVVYTADGKLVGSSADGSLANARAMTEAQVLGELAAWAK